MKIPYPLKAFSLLAIGLLVFSCQKNTKETELSLSTRAASFYAEAGEETVSVTSNDSWTVSGGAAWISIAPTSGSGSGSFKISVQANEDFLLRSAEIAVSAGNKVQTVKVSQLPPTPSLEVTPASLEVASDGAGYEIQVTANAPWTLAIPVDCDWIAADKAEGNGNATVLLTVRPNILREAREAVVTIKETIGGVQKEVTVSQEMGPRSRLTDSLALVALYEASDGAHWKDGRVWDLTKPMDDAESKWYGVTLDAETGRVTALKLMNGTITGEWTIPAAIAELDALTDLRFNGCQVAGTLPEALYDLPHLKTFYLMNNKVSGSLSAKIAQWSEMEELFVSQNAGLGGSLPKEIGSLKKLKKLSIAQTDISGSIPAELAGCEGLVDFMANDTKLSGEIPDIWDQLPNLGSLMLYNCDLTGGLPASLGKCAKIKSIQLYQNNLTGNIPESFAQLPSTATTLRVQGNRLSGVVPAAVKAHANWEKWKPAQYIFPQQEGYGLE